MLLATRTLVLCLLNAVAAINIESLIAKANIYFQKPLQQGEPHELLLNSVEILPNKQNLKVIVHGFLGSRTHGSIRPLGNAYMAEGVPNVLLADWQDAAGRSYHSSREAVGIVAVYFAKMLYDFFDKHQIKRSEVHVIGHSLGAHIAGGIGRYFNGTLGRVTGLDPALPLFSSHSPDSLKARDAQFVDVIHTDYPIFGDATPRGTIDFYPNFGYAPQPGCDDVDFLTASKFILEAYSCSHNRAVILYAESISSPRAFPTIPCSMNAIKQRNASLCLKDYSIRHFNDSAMTTLTPNMEETDTVYMGEYVSHSAAGYYYLDTYDTSPYGMGANAKF